MAPLKVDVVRLLVLISHVFYVENAAIPTRSLTIKNNLVFLEAHLVTPLQDSHLETKTNLGGHFGDALAA